MVVAREIETKKRGKREMGEEREMSFFILLSNLYYFIGMYVKIKTRM